MSSGETAAASSCPASMASVMPCLAYSSKYRLMVFRPTLPTWSSWKVRAVSPSGSSTISLAGGSKSISFWSMKTRTLCQPVFLSSTDEAELDSRDWQSRMADSMSALARWASISIMTGRMVGAEGMSAMVPRLSRTTTLNAPSRMSPFPVLPSPLSRAFRLLPARTAADPDDLDAPLLRFAWAWSASRVRK